MCMTCVAQGVVYVGGAATGLRVMATRARAARARREGSSQSPPAPVDEDAGDQCQPGPVVAT